MGIMEKKRESTIMGYIGFREYPETISYTETLRAQILSPTGSPPIPFQGLPFSSWQYAHRDSRGIPPCSSAAFATARE